MSPMSDQSYVNAGGFHSTVSQSKQHCLLSKYIQGHAFLGLHYENKPIQIY